MINKKINIPEDSLYNLYVSNKLTQREIAEIFQCSRVTISKKLKTFNIKRRKNED